MITALKQRVREIRRSNHDAKLQSRRGEVGSFLVSYPKSGRTWLRYLLSLYMARAYDLGFEPDLLSTFRILPNYDLDQERGLPSAERYKDGQMPLVAVSHRDYDGDLFGQTPVIMLLRDPRDVLVSSYFHQTRHKHRFEGDIPEFIESGQYGAASIADYHNGWAAGLEGRRSLILSYEDMSTDTHAAVRRTLEFLGVAVDEAVLDEAVRKAQFDKMRKKEKQTGIPGHDYNREDADASRVRRGKVAGYTDYLGPEDDARVQELFAQHLTDAATALYRRTGFIA
ncbi:sulfotransferase domain-containing protein [Erythrobacter sp. MTPC3]|uniref:sulfotransferase domain-containing protein n=1 Tax=Erythrobacter sp. MTPC3 TaxID=3056564 RepID=UPI0036F3A9CA